MNIHKIRKRGVFVLYFDYHNSLKKLLNEEEYICVKEKGEFAYRFIFPKLMKSYPIREYRVKEYEKYIKC